MTENRPMQIEGIEITNYRQFRHVEFTNLPPMTVLVGANGAGKSTLLDVFAFLKDALSENVAAAVARRGGFSELVSRDQHGPIQITIKFRRSEGRVVTYLLRVGLEKGRAAVLREVLTYSLGQTAPPWRIVDFTKGEGHAITNESAYGQQGAVEERRDYALEDSSILAIKGLGQFHEFRLASELRSLIERWHISNLQVPDVRGSIDDGYDEHLSPRGENAALVAQYLHQSYPDIFDQVLRAMNSFVPGISAVEPTPTGDGRLALRFRDQAFERPFVGRHVSDGTVRMFAYLLLLQDPKPHPLLAVQEPENQLYPQILWNLAKELRTYAKRGGQVFVTTHSPEFLDNVDEDEVFYIVKENGFSTFVRPNDSEHPTELDNGGEAPESSWRQGRFDEILK